MKKNLEELYKNLKNNYDYGEGDDLGADFFTPCLELCSKYDRATSDFTSNVIYEWGEAILKLVDIDNHDCKIRMIAHHKLHDDDYKVLKDYVDNENKIDEYLEKIANGIIMEAYKLAEGNADKETKLKLFSYLIATRRLEIRFAFPHHVRNANVFHQKYGIFNFKDNKKIAFLGSPNETIGGHSKNIETIEVFNSLINTDLKRINSWENKFEKSWENESKGFRTKTISKETLERIISYSPKSANKFRQSLDATKNTKKDTVYKKKQETFSLWPHQQEAVKKFLEIRSGILEMATGTGKTKTSLEILKILLKENKINSCIVSTEGNALLDQWYAEIIDYINKNENLRENIKKIYRHFSSYKEAEKFLYNPTNSILIISRENLQKYLNYLDVNKKQNIFVIHDEVHGFGSPGNIKKLSGSHKEFIYKLGMSATPDREYGEEGNNFISTEIGETFYKFSLEDAINSGVLCKMNYITQNYYLSDDENEEIKKIIKSHHAKKSAGEKVTEEDLAIRISKVRKNALIKIKNFAEYIKNDPESINNTIIFVYSKERGRQISQILEGKIKYSEFFDSDVSDRLVEFSEGKLNCLITCHRLSQGIDIQGLKNIFLLASDRSKLETIQRIGRCLRKNPKEPNKKAKVVDFVDTDYDGDVFRKEWLENLSKI